MIVGIISDVHDHLDNLRDVLGIFNGRGVEHVIHAGDFVSPSTWRAFEHFKGGFTGIFGNNDSEKVLLNKLYLNKIYTQPYIFSLNNKKIVVNHEPDAVNTLVDSRYFDLIVYGHTHKPIVKEIKNATVVNPGEVCGWAYGKPTAAIVNLDDMNAEIIFI